MPSELQFKPEELAADAGAANLVLEIGGKGSQIGQWVYALAAPFPTLIDGVKIGDVKSTWQGISSGNMQDINLLVDAPTRRVLERAWGSPSARVNTLAAGDLLEYGLAGENFLGHPALRSPGSALEGDPHRWSLPI